MRNTIELWIGAERADLDNSSFLLLNYTMEDLSNPTIVKNSFSRQITLKGTPQNNRIFGGIYRNDRNVDTSVSGETGAQFDPTRKTSFQIFNEAGELLEDGYLKLDKVTVTKKRIEYTVTLYGGLGSFLYGLSYDANGDKRTLADLDFGEVLDFTIDRDAVADAWARLDGDTTKDAKWDIINFIPGYMGLPSSPFDANKCFVYPWAVGLKYRSDDGTYNAPQTIVTLNEKVTGNAANDFRSYLQKPVIKLSALINAICDPSNNGGYSVNLDSDFFTNTNPYWDYTWLTLPALYDLNINDAESTTTQTMTALNTMLPIVGGGGVGLYKVTVNANPTVDMTGLPALDYELWCRNAYGASQNLFVIKLTLFDSSQNEIATAKYYITTDGVNLSGLPTPDFTFDHISSAGHFVDANGNDVTFPLYIEAQGAAYYQVELDCENNYVGAISHYPGDLSWYMWQENETTFANTYRFDPTMVSTSVQIISSSSSTVRTGATITQSALLGGGHTPADYLLSLCKMFGLQMVCHKGEKVIDIIERDNFYSTATPTDINARIDRGQPMEKHPFAFDARWYLFGNEAKGEFAEYYASRYNRPFGQYRVNTGYEFDADEKNMTDDIVFGNVCALMEASPYFCDLVRDGHNIPAVFLAGGTYLLYRGSETMSMDVPYLADAAKTWRNTSYPMHDAWENMQFHGEQDAHIDERDTLVFFGGFEDTSSMHLSLTDDTEEMLYLNGNNPCWMPNICDVDPSWKIDRLPKFSRYVWGGVSISQSLDFGDPTEIQIPGATFGVNSNVFDLYWRKYISDRYDDDSAVVTCWVDLRGYQVGVDLFRQFYWFDGCVWAMNRIINYSLTTSGPVQCEFVKVQNTTNYTSL